MHETQARQGVRRGAAVLLAMVLALSLGWQRTWADEERQLIPVGKAVGIKLFADGVLVVSVSPVQGTEETRSPAKECGLKEGDILLTFNGEKIRSTVRKQGRYKKQTGGSGQFGDVHIIFEPQTEQEDMIFAENVFGGSVPKNYFPAVEKGLRESCLHGVLAGYPVVYLKATLVDGSYHPVDSSEIAFKLAANLAFKAALPEAKPVLMEPIGELKVTVPDNYVGDVMGDLNKRRGRVMGMNPTGDGETVLEAEVPMAEMMSYAIDLRSMTQSRGTFTFNFVRYEDCPAAAQEKAIAEAKALADAE
jgi:elongation factor G